MKKTIGWLALLAALLLPVLALADVIPVDEAHFPDPVFRAYMEREFGSGIDEDEQFEVVGFHIEDAGISSLEGIQYLPSLENLICHCGQMTVLDVSGMTELQTLTCGGGKLTSLNVSGCSALREVNCEGNSLIVYTDTGKYDLSRLPGFDPARIQRCSAAAPDGAPVKASLSGSTLTLEKPALFSYLYDAGEGFSVTFTLDVRFVAKDEILTLPAGLEVIEEEAFMGILARVVVVPDECRRIEARAFVDCPNLVEISVPRNCEVMQNACDASVTITRR